MGQTCNCGRRAEEELLHTEESIITSHEQKLKYQTLLPRMILNTFRRFANDGKIEKPGFLEACASLNININGISNKKNPVYKLYNNYEKKGLINQRVLTTMGILLSKYVEKEECIFDLYDTNESGNLSEDEVDLMLTDVFVICATFLTEFANRYDKTELISQYGSQMRSNLLNAIALGRSFILNSSTFISKDEFVSRVRRGKWMRTTTAVRKFMISSRKKPLPLLRRPTSAN